MKFLKSILNKTKKNKIDALISENFFVVRPAAFHSRIVVGGR